MRTMRMPGAALGTAKARLRKVLGESTVRVVPRSGKRGGVLVLFGPVFPGPSVIQDGTEVLFAAPVAVAENFVALAMAS